MNRTDMEILRTCRPGLRIRILSCAPKSDALWWWDDPRNTDIMASRGVFIEGIVQWPPSVPKYSLNRGFTGYVLLGEHAGRHWTRRTHVMLYNAKIEIWKDGEPKRDIRIVRGRRHAAHASR